ncbi:GNAT family N-acetyltransferase [Paractinoplanes ferrugineus]|uniref:GNAT family N-acetyltransferase n=1 Tax=Paractinoplanes ferrugineus TaxID=113564 RepID=UPI0031D703A7
MLSSRRLNRRPHRDDHDHRRRDARRARRARTGDIPARHRHRQRHLRDRTTRLGPVHRVPAPEHRFVALDQDGAVLGWIACGPVSDRCVYAGVVEHSVYVHLDARGRGVGRTLLDALIASTEAAGIWTIQSGIFPENTASLALHATCGFRTVGTRRRVGRHHGAWRDVVLIERRSPTIT